jgi:PAS domain S-box-containing protein
MKRGEREGRFRKHEPAMPCKRVSEVEAKSRNGECAVAERDESEDIFSAIFNSSPDVQLIVDDESGTILNINKAVKRILHYQSQDIVGKHYSILYPPEYEKPREDFLDEITVYGSVLEGGRLVKADGTLLPVELTATMIPWDSGEAILVTFRDMSDREQAQQSLRESEEKYRHLAELLPGIVFEIDLSKAFTFVNRSGLAALGYHADELIGRGSPLEIVVPSERQGFLNDMEEVFKGQTLTGNEYTALRKDGSSFPVAVHATPMTRDNRIVGFRGVGIDITELKRIQKALEGAKKTLEVRVEERTAELAESNQRLRSEVTERTRAQEALRKSEQRLRAIFETATDCIFIKDRSLTYTLVNPAMEQLLGLPQSEIVGRTDYDLFGKEAGDHLKAVDFRVLTGESIEEEHTRLFKGSSTTFIDVRAPMRDNQRTIVGVCGISRNITERRKTLLPKRSGDPEYSSSTMRNTLDQAQMAAHTETITLLTGESGTGKDYLARYIHENSKRSSGPFYSINCAALPPELAESELFGHEAGAFTGASGAKRGLLELAEGGTLLLNEIGELSLSLQAKLLTFIDTRAFTRVGGEKSIKVNARLIAATNRDLEKEVAEGRFRTDLFFRLNVLRIRVPSLRERREDIPTMVQEILTQIGAELQLPSIPKIDSDNMKRLKRYRWPGNVRELRNVLERALIISDSGELNFDFVTENQDESTHWSWKTAFPPDVSLPELVKNLKRSILVEALERTEDRKNEAARLLGISRHILRRQIEAAGLASPGKPKSK